MVVAVVVAVVAAAGDGCAAVAASQTGRRMHVEFKSTKPPNVTDF